MLPDDHRPPRRGRYIAFTGIDGAGKSTQAGQLAQYLRGTGRHVYLAEAKENFTVEMLSAIAHRNGHASPRLYYGLESFDLARALDALRDHTHLVAPLLQGGSDVVAPRSPYCRLGLMRAHGSRNVRKVEEILLYAGAPDLVVFVDVPAELAHERIRRRGTDEEDLALLKRFHDALREISRGAGWIEVDGSGPAARVAAEVRRQVVAHLDGTAGQVSDDTM